MGTGLSSPDILSIDGGYASVKQPQIQTLMAFDYQVRQWSWKVGHSYSQPSNLPAFQVVTDFEYQNS